MSTDLSQFVICSSNRKQMDKVAYDKIAYLTIILIFAPRLKADC